MSVIVPVFNAAPWLDDCLMSVLAQSNVNLELICVDDGSTDDSDRMLSQWAQRDSRVTVLQQPNSGQSVARNRGLDCAKGRYMVYVDSDDYWAVDALSRIVRVADREQLDVLMFDGIAFRDGDVDENLWNWYSTYYQRSRAYRRTRTGAALIASMRRNRDYRPHVGLYLARTEAVIESGVRFIPDIVHQDNPYTFRLLLHARKVSHRPLGLYARRLRPGSTITTLRAPQSARGYYLAYLEMSRELRSVVVSRAALPVIEGIVSSVYDSAMKQFAVLADDELDDLARVDRSAEGQRVFAALRAQLPLFALTDGAATSPVR